MESFGTTRRNADATRRRILDAAIRAFSQTGYSYTGIREVAAMASASPTLLLRYFGSKAGLFEAALREAIPHDWLSGISAETLAQVIVNAALDPDRANKPMQMIAMASGEPEAADIAARILADHVLEPINHLLQTPDGRVRAVKVAILSMGFSFFLQHLPLRNLDQPEREALSKWFGETMHGVLTPGLSGTAQG